MKTQYFMRQLPDGWTDFKVLGLSQLETIVLNILFDLRGGELSTKIIAGEAEIPRQTANSILKSLTRRGLIIEAEFEGVPVFSTSVEVIAKYIDDKCEKFQLLKAMLKISQGT